MDGRLYAMLWRWHFLAALIVVPFVLWQSTTGTIYLWAERLVDQRHPSLRFVEARGMPAPVSAQVAAALATAPQTGGTRHSASQGHGGHSTPAAQAGAEQRGPGVAEVVLPGDPGRSTTVLLLTDSGLPWPVFVDPYGARVLGALTAAEWLPGWSRALHGGWPLGAAGSWLLELGAGWAIFMIVSGLYLWWPRGRGFLAALVPRLHQGRRILVRDLHATVAVLFSAVFLFFLVSALPWTSFWGGQVLSRVQSLLGQQGSAGFSPGGASTGRMEEVLRPIDSLVAEARARGLGPGMSIRLAPWPNAPLYLMSRDNPPADDRVLLGDPVTGRVVWDVSRTDEPAIPRTVGFGIHVHQGDFGAWNVWLNTAFALSLVWLSVTGALSWLMRRPGRGWGVPPQVRIGWPRPLVAAACLMGAVLPLFGASVLLLLAVERSLRGRFVPRS
ncbi:MAG: PepSY domain-containing protein [Enhydrobacter sp.]|nr:PepSY domain-containing protein [Enhydrobacter sp.]